jgi:hypothetical protein
LYGVRKLVLDLLWVQVRVRVRVRVSITVRITVRVGGWG